MIKNICSDFVKILQHYTLLVLSVKQKYLKACDSYICLSYKSLQDTKLKCTHEC